MKSIIILIFSRFLLLGALPFFKRANYDWFWDKDFRDNTEHDNDPAREFFRRSTTRRANEVVTQQPDYDHTAGPDYTTQDDLTAEPDYYTTEEYTTEPDYNPEETSYVPDYNTEEPETEPDYYTREPVTEPDYYTGELVTEPDYYTGEPVTEPDYRNTAQPDEPDYEITTAVPDNADDKIRNKAYYEKRKKQALRCEGNEHVTLKMDQIGNPNCQICTCNGEGVLLCSSVSCSDNGLEVREDHEKLLHNSDSAISLILREYATDCKPGTTVHAQQCTCSCVLPSVMSCPKECFYADTDDVTVASDIIVGITITQEGEVFNGVDRKQKY